MVCGIVSLGVYIGQFRLGPIRRNHSGGFWVGLARDRYAIFEEMMQDWQSTRNEEIRESECRRRLGLEREMGVRIPQGRH